MEESYDCAWYFEDTDNHLRTFDTGQFRNVTILHATHFKSFFWVQGLFPLLRRKDCCYYLLLGHSRNLSTTLFLVVKNLLHRDKKCYLWTHGWYGKESFLEKMWKRFIMCLADGIFFYGNYGKGIAIQEGVNPDKCFVIHNSLDYVAQLAIREKLAPSNIYRQHFGNDYPVIIFIGRLNKTKRLDMLISSLDYLQRQGTKCNLVFVGDGPMKTHLEQQVSEADFRSQIWFYGASYDEAVNAELIYNADVCVSPGNVGLTSIHSMMFGCPVISHDDFTHQMPEFEAIIDGQTGAFFKQGNQASLNNVLLSWLLENREKREEIRQSCYKEIDSNWNPDYQMNILRSVIK